MTRCQALIRFAALGALLSAALVCNPHVRAQEPAGAARGPDLRRQPGQWPGDGLLFNGWGLTPAGEHVRTSDLILKMVVAPDRKRLVAVSGGYSDHGLTLLDPVARRVTQFLPLEEAWNGLAFSNDGRRIFVPAGDKGEVHVFAYAH